MLGTNYYKYYDEDIAVPFDGWETQTFVPSFEKFMFQYNVFQNRNGNDCNKQAAYGKSVASIMYAQTNPETFNSGISVGSFFYVTRGGTFHVINVIITYNSTVNGYIVSFYDPEIHKMVFLDAEEKEAGLELSF